MPVTKKSRRHPITKKDVIPADLMKDAQAGVPFYALTDDEIKEFAGLSPKLQDKVVGIANAAIVGRAGCDPDDSSVTPTQADDYLDDMFGDDDENLQKAA